MLFRVECPNCTNLISPTQIGCENCDNEFIDQLTRIWWQQESEEITATGMWIYHAPHETDYLQRVKSSCVIRLLIDFIASEKSRNYFSFNEFLKFSKIYQNAHNVEHLGVKVQLLKDIKHLDDGKIAGEIKGMTAVSKLIIFNSWLDNWSHNWERIKYISNEASNEDYEAFINALNDISLKIFKDAGEYFEGEHLILKALSIQDEVEERTNHFSRNMND